MKALQLLYESDDLPRFGLPPELRAMYGGDLGIARPRVFANFVSSVDGIVTLREGGESGRIISGASEADHFVMALLRACADVVLIGAGTFRKAPGDLWRSENVYPEMGARFADVRTQLALRPEPLLVVVTATGAIDTSQPALRDALIATTTEGEAKLRNALPAGARVVAFGSGAVMLRPLVELLRAEGHLGILTEGGPTLVGELIAARLLDELFVTSSPKLFGRASGDGRKSLVEGTDLGGRSLELLSARRQGSHLFLRYQL